MMALICSLPTERDLATIRFTAHPGVQFKKLPHALAVNTSAGDSGLAAGEMAD